VSGVSVGNKPNDKEKKEKGKREYKERKKKKILKGGVGEEEGE